MCEDTKQPTNCTLENHLPDHNYDKVENIPAIPKVGPRVKHKTKGHYLKKCFDTKYTNEIILQLVL